MDDPAFFPDYSRSGHLLSFGMDGKRVGKGFRISFLTILTGRHGRKTDQEAFPDPTDQFNNLPDQVHDQQHMDNSFTHSFTNYFLIVSECGGWWVGELVID